VFFQNCQILSDVVSTEQQSLVLVNVEKFYQFFCTGQQFSSVISANMSGANALDRVMFRIIIIIINFICKALYT